MKPFLPRLLSIRTVLSIGVTFLNEMTEKSMVIYPPPWVTMRKIESPSKLKIACRSGLDQSHASKVLISSIEYSKMEPLNCRIEENGSDDFPLYELDQNFKPP